MLIYLANQYYLPDGATGKDFGDLASFLAEKGHEVHMFCGRAVYEQHGSARRTNDEEKNDVHVHRLYSTRFGRSSRAGQILNYLTYYCALAVRLLLGRKPDLIIIGTSPPHLNVLGALLSVVFGTKSVAWLFDLYPEVGVAGGIWAPRGPIAVVQAHIACVVLRSVTHVVPVGRCMQRRILEKGVGRGATTVITTWSDGGSGMLGCTLGNPLRERLRFGDKFVLQYSGNLGIGHCFDEVVETAKRLNDMGRYEFVFIGGGRRLEELKAEVRRKELTCVTFLNYFPREELDLSMTLGDAHLVSLRREMCGAMVPGKVYTAMKYGRPVIFVGPEESEVALSINEYGCGIVVPNGDVEGLISAIVKLSTDRRTSEEMGKRGREAFVTHYEKGVCCEKWVKLIEGYESSTPMKLGRAGKGEGVSIGIDHMERPAHLSQNSVGCSAPGTEPHAKEGRS